MQPVGHEVTHSTWNARTLAWDYWLAPAGLREGVIAPPPKIARDPRGVAPERAERPLPVGATPVGSGPVARGQVASARRRALALGGLATETSVILTAGAVVLGYLYLRRS